MSIVQPTAPLSSIWIDREARQRTAFSIEDLLPSVRKHGILQPVVVAPEPGPSGEAYKLVAGERRCATAAELNLRIIPIVLFSDLSLIAQREIELEENVKRRALSWQDEALAVAELHDMHLADDPTWDQDKTALACNLSSKHVYRCIDIAAQLRSNDQGILRADGFAQASTILARRREREKGERLNSIFVVDPKQIKARVKTSRADDEQVEDEPEEVDDPYVPPPPPFEIVCADALQWMADYSGQPFNFLHLDLPYGVPLNGQANQASMEEGYTSSPEIYWPLCKAFADNFDKLAFPSCHIMFWFSFEFRDETLEFFSTHPLTRRIEWQNIPLIWHKTDNKGILSDPLRRPRNIGEYALLGACGDRPLVRPKSNIYGSPTTKFIHPNEKPVPMLKHFFEMLIDEHSRVFDPTVGGGTCIQVAEELGAEAGIGLEFNETMATRAQVELLKTRNLRAMSAAVKNGARA